MALDEKGIYLSEVDKRYPRSFQTLGYDVLMDTDSTYKPKVISTFEMCVNAILTLLYMKPANHEKGELMYISFIDIESYLHEYADDPNIPSEIKNKLTDQCNRIEVTGIQIDCYIDQTDDGTNALVVKVTGTDKLGYGSQSGNVIIGISYDKLNRLYVRKSYI